MMFCLRLWLSLLLLPLPLALSPVHTAGLIVTLVAITRPCLYCSLLLIILFASFWGGALMPENASLFNDQAWLLFVPRLYTIPATSTNETVASFAIDLANSTVSTLGSAAVSSAVESGADILSKLTSMTGSSAMSTSMGAGGVGTGWLKTLLGRSEWTLPCVNVKVVL